MFEFIHHSEYGRCDLKALRSFFMYFLRNSYMQPCRWKCPWAERHGAKKKVCLILTILVVHFFSLVKFAPSLCMTSPSNWPLQYDYEVSEFFQEILQGSLCWSLESGPQENISMSLIIRVQEFKFGPWIWFKSDVHKIHRKKKTM
jgi:hypothetical protein